MTGCRVLSVLGHPMIQVLCAACIQAVPVLLKASCEHAASNFTRPAVCCSENAVLTAFCACPAGNLWGFQLWICLPKKDKMIKPRYQDIQVLQHGLALCSSIV